MAQSMTSQTPSYRLVRQAQEYHLACPGFPPPLFAIRWPNFGGRIIVASVHPAGRSGGYRNLRSAQALRHPAPEA